MAGPVFVQRIITTCSLSLHACSHALFLLILCHCQGFDFNIAVWLRFHKGGHNVIVTMISKGKL